MENVYYIMYSAYSMLKSLLLIFFNVQINIIE